MGALIEVEGRVVGARGLERREKRSMLNWNDCEGDFFYGQYFFKYESLHSEIVWELGNT